MRSKLLNPELDENRVEFCLKSCRMLSFLGLVFPPLKFQNLWVELRHLGLHFVHFHSCKISDFLRLKISVSIWFCTAPFHLFLLHFGLFQYRRYLVTGGIKNVYPISLELSIVLASKTKLKCYNFNAKNDIKNWNSTHLHNAKLNWVEGSTEKVKRCTKIQLSPWNQNFLCQLPYKLYYL